MHHNVNLRGRSKILEVQTELRAGARIDSRMRAGSRALLKIHGVDGLVSSVLLRADAKAVRPLVDQLGISQTTIGFCMRITVELWVSVCTHLDVSTHRICLRRHRYQDTVDGLIERAKKPSSLLALPIPHGDVNT